VCGGEETGCKKKAIDNELYSIPPRSAGKDVTRESERAEKEARIKKTGCGKDDGRLVGERIK